MINGVIFHGKQIVRENVICKGANPVLHDVTKRTIKYRAIENTPDLSVMRLLVVEVSAYDSVDNSIALCESCMKKELDYYN